MNPWFIWKDKNSLSDFGLWIAKLPKRVRPEERHEEIEIPGRSGSLLMLEGEDVYSSYTAEMTVIARNSLHIDQIAEWLRGSSDLILSTDIDKARSARIVGEVSFERVGNWLQQATIPFLFQPFRKSRNPEINDRIQVTSSSTSIYNPGDVASKPVVTINGSGNNTITMGGSSMTFVLGDTAVTIVVDCEAQIITVGDSIWTGSYSGEFWSIPKGQSAVTKSGNATLTVDPNWRWF